MSRALNIRFLGAARTVTGSKTLITYNGKKYLIDCGLFQGPSEMRKHNWEPIPEAREISKVILTHAHIDHSGYLPKLVTDGYQGPIYCSHPTKDLCRILLLDAAHLQEEDAEFANKTKYSKYSPALPLYTTQDAEKAIRLLHGVNFYEWVQLDLDLSFRLIRSGHILGSAFVQIHYMSNEGPKILTFSGDLGNNRSFVLEPPEQISETDFLVMESTYGDRKHENADPVEAIGKIIQTVIGRGGTLVIPAFSVGRTQELLHIMHLLEEKKQIPKCPVYLDSPMAKNVTAIYKKHSEELKSSLRSEHIETNLCSAHYHEVQDADESMLLCMSDEPKVVISAAGMLNGGRVLHHLKMKLPGEKNGVLFVGFQAQGTKGLLLKNGLRNIRIHHQNIDVEAQIFNIESMSAHADSDEILDFIRRMSKKPEMTFLNHGEPNSLESLHYRLLHELNLQATIAEPETDYKI